MIRLVKVIICILVILTLVDAGFLVKYIAVHSQQLGKTSFSRLVTFVLSHLYFSLMLGVLYQLDEYAPEEIQVYKYSEWLVNTFIPIAAIDTMIEVSMFIILGTQKHSSSVLQQNVEFKDQELHLINFYFMIYMYATIIGILAAIHLGVNRVLERFEKAKYEDLIEAIVDKYFLEFDEDDPKIANIECSICQLEFTTQSNINRNGKAQVVNLQCHHMFHKECILEWVKKTYQESISPRCPNCRRPIQQ